MIRKLLLTLTILIPFPAAAAEFECKDGDRVVLIGGTLIEREQRYGYWETALTAANPDKNITFRNLGWSGDTVWGEARAGFGTAADGYKHLIEHVKSLNPTVIILGYGSNESFAGEAGLPKFKDQLKKFLNDLADTKARFVFLAPPQIDKPMWKYGNVDQREQMLKLYGDAIKDEATARGARFVPDISQRYGPTIPLTDNGMHFTAWGYRFTAFGLVFELGQAKKVKEGDKGIELSGLDKTRFTHRILPRPPSPLGPGVAELDGDSAVLVRQLEPGNYSLKIDGRVVKTVGPAEGREWMRSRGQLPIRGVTSRSADEWKTDIFTDRVLVLDGPSLDQAEKLRQAIIAKNELYFHRWRPANVTYLFGFRKHEQGNNAVEIPQFDPLVAAKEKEIAKLRKPIEHVYELVPVK